MSVGGTIVDLVVVRPARVWVNTWDGHSLCAVFVNPKGERLEVGDGLWWHGGYALWTPRVRPDGRSDVKLEKTSYSGVEHPDLPRCHICGKLATCIGEYETCTGIERPACDDCCGHGNEDGHCQRIAKAVI